MKQINYIFKQKIDKISKGKKKKDIETHVWSGS